MASSRRRNSSNKTTKNLFPRNRREEVLSV